MDDLERERQQARQQEADQQSSENRRQEREKKREERARKRFLQLCKHSPDVPQIMLYRNAWNKRRVGQRNRRFIEQIEREYAIEQLLPLPTAAHLVNAMRWHRHYYYILVIATHPGVTLQELTNLYGLPHSNHRMVIHRLIPDLARLGWKIESSPRTVQNEPWGWWLKQCDIQNLSRYKLALR